MAGSLTIGVLAVQGDFAEHAAMLRRADPSVLVREVRTPKDLIGLDGLIVPGGESTAMGKLLVAYGLEEPIRSAARAGLPVWGTCAGMILLAREIIEIVRGYNELVQRSGMPPLELGIGITLQESAPLYLMDGEHKIMISEALNESDRLSSCNKRARMVMESQAGPFHVYAFQAADPEPGGNPEDVVLSFNLSGIRMNDAAFRKLQQEISLEPLKVKLPASFASSDKGEYRLFSGTVPVDRDIFRKIVVRESRVPRVDPADFSVQGWTERSYYEVCADPAIYAALEKGKAAKR